LKCQILLNNKVVESSDRMVTEYQGMPFAFANHNAGFAWTVDYEGSTPATLSLWLQATGTKIGIQTDSNGWNSMQLVKVSAVYKLYTFNLICVQRNMTTYHDTLLCSHHKTSLSLLQSIVAVFTYWNLVIRQLPQRPQQLRLDLQESIML